jgi:DNA-binding NtrC family response regulator
MDDRPPAGHRSAVLPQARTEGTQLTIQIGLYSNDRKLQPVLSSSLGKEFQVRLSPDEAGIIRMLDSGDCDVAILDLEADKNTLQNRIECFRRIIASRENPAVLIMADDSLRTSAAELVRLGAYGYLRRPPSIRDLKAMLLRAHENSSLKRELQTVQQRVDEEATCCDKMKGSSPQMQQVYELIRRVASINASVLVTGESGTGKELVATAIHNLGRRSGHPFIAVSCGAIPETLIEAELFGHEKGAFTGTVGARVGLMEQAGEGTLFLDEIGDLSPSIQVKLLRVLQQREFSRLGSNRLIPLQARLIFATHRDLGEMVAQGTFRQDLYYRINVMRIHAPALQERREDISEIANHFLRVYSEMYQKPMAGIEVDAVATLEGYTWPGNVRELENVIQRAIIVAQDTMIKAEDLPQHIQDESIISIDDYQPASSFERQLRDYKIKLAVNAVREHNGNKTLAARSLQISRAYLHRLIRGAGGEEGIESESPKLEIA